MSIPGNDKKKHAGFSVQSSKGEKPRLTVVDTVNSKPEGPEIPDQRHLFSTIINSASEAIFAKDASGKYQVVNEAGARMIGLTVTEVLGHTDLELLPAATAHEFRKSDEYVMSTGQPYKTKETGLINGRIHQFLANKTPWFDSSGEIIGVIGVTTDITDQVKSENALKRSEERFRHVTTTISDLSYSCVLLADGNYSIDWMTGTAEKITGYSIGEIIGFGCWGKLVMEEDLDIFRKNVAGLTPGSSGRCELRLRNKQGGILWVASYAECFHDSDYPGNCIVYGALIDITDRKLAETELRENERLLMETQAVARLGSYVWKITDGLWKSSKILDGIFGIDENYLRSLEGWLGLIHPDWRREMSDYVENEVIGKGQVFDKEYMIINHTTGREVWVHGMGQLEFDSRKQPVKLIGTISDITERKHAEIALKKNSDELEQFNNLMVGREIRMIELKKEINELLKKNGGEEKYTLHS